MASTDYDFIQTRNEIVERAFRIVGVIGAEDTLTAGQLNQGAIVLNAVVKAWQARKTFLWTLETFTESLVDGVSNYPLPTDPPIVTCYSGFIRDPYDNDLPLIQKSYREYLAIVDKTIEAEPTVFTLTGSDIIFYPVPDASYTFVGIGVTKLQDWDASDSTGGFPAKWINALVFAVAEQLSHEYGLPVGERRQLASIAKEEFTLVRASAEEEETDTCRTRGAFRV